MNPFRRDRRSPRHNVHHTVWALPEEGFAKRQCVILDLSGSGAKISTSDPDFLGSTFGLALTQDVRRLTMCRLVWRDGDMLGVEFRD